MVKRIDILNFLAQFKFCAIPTVQTVDMGLQFDYISKYNLTLINTLKKYANIKIVKNEIHNYIHPIYNFKNDNDAIEYLANDILSKNIPFDKVFIYGINKDNESTLKRILNNYHININLSSNTAIFDTKIGLDFLNNLDNYAEFLESINNDEIKGIIIDILNKYYWIQNKSLVKDMLTYDIKHTNINNQKYQNAINEIDIFDNYFDDDEYIYILNFNKEYIPKVFKDEDYINDKEKFTFMETSLEKNILEKEKWKNKISSIKNLTILSSEQNLNGSLNESPLVLDNNYKVIDKEHNTSNYSNKSNNYNLGILLDNFIKNGTVNNNLYNLITTYPSVNYLKYDNKFTNIVPNNISFNLSYSKMNTYYECPFKYYCDNILKLKKHEDTFDTWTGSLSHYILSKIYDDNYDFETSKQEYIDNNPYNLTYENTVFLNKILNELKDAINYIQSLTKINKYKTIECEKYIETTIDNIKFNGIIDKVMRYEDKIVLIDYKTGNPDIDLRLAKYGLNLQLPTYIYLIKQIYPDSKIVGIYLQHILKPNFNKILDKSEKELHENHLKLVGYSIGNESLLEEFDPTYQNSDFIKGLKLTKDGFSKTSKVLTENNFKNLEELTKKKIDECIKDIKNAKFDINPKISGINNISCPYCPYKSICFTSEKDKKYVYLDKDLSILGGVSSDYMD